MTAPDRDFQQTVLSPCIGICQIGSHGLCEGCYRSGDEIASWLQMSSAQRLQLMDEVLPQRQQLLINEP